MEPINSREFRKRLRKFCLEQGWEFIENPKRGKGDHRSYILRRTDENGRRIDEIPIVFDGGRKEVPAGTRRIIIRSLRALRDRISNELARQAVREFVDSLIEFLQTL